jgi:hypothetical protein
MPTDRQSLTGHWLLFDCQFQLDTAVGRGNFFQTDETAGRIGCSDANAQTKKCSASCGNASTSVRNALWASTGHFLGHNSLEMTQRYILEDEAQINGTPSQFDLLYGVE